ncbi:ABC transporter ATP-binding protein [Streptomyces purpureus]|uniref:ABC transporter ATP-binding protein n=1 Tax=Streptomyces purpureus TaxID=1951 RepID=A0A918LRW6_9ACTN|nr:ATP-binding cassette domain-containing protein [Streptomyces purpureus]GGT40987.1 ABC transporter ATP-binding protein [Streptomyces purpureus]
MSVEMELRAARVRYGPLEALHGIDLPVPAGTLTVLLGRNGAGRTTALRALAGIVPLSAGRVLWRGRDVTGLRAHDRARRGLCFVPDLRAVYAGLTVAENLELASPKGTYDSALGVYPELRPLLARRAGTLSGGERRMLALARVALAPARVVLVDEPCLGMAPAVAARTYALLASLDAAVVVAEQRLPAGLPAGSLVHELRRGRLAFSGESGERPPGSSR